MDQTTESATSSPKTTEKNISNDMDCEKINTSSTTSGLPNVLMMGFLLLCTGITIYAGYRHGDMHLLTLLKNAKQFYD